MGSVKLLKPEEAGLTEKIQIFEDGIRTEAKSGSYEWWYFDSKYADGSSLVIIFYTKPVTSFAKAFKPFVSLNYISPYHSITLVRTARKYARHLNQRTFRSQRIAVTSESEIATSKATFRIMIFISKTTRLNVS